MEFNICNKIINIYINGNSNKLPVIIINSYTEDGLNIIYECNKIKCKEFILVSISNLDWNNELTPWKNDIFLGNADNYIKELDSIIIPKIEEIIIDKFNKEILYYSLIGYSLAGLFSIYSLFKTNRFKRIASISGSLWYPNIKECIINNSISNNVDRIYLSLGDKEALTKNLLMSKVEENTKNIYEYFNKKVNSIYELNSGNHFKDENKRIAKAIKKILED